MKLWGFKDCHFGQFGTINARYISRYYSVSGNLIRLRNRCKLVKRSLFTIIDLLQEAKSILLYFIWRVGDDIHKKFQILEKKRFHFILLHLFF